YVTNAGSDVSAIDAATGEELWRYDHQMSRPVSGERNRGAAVAYGKLFVATEDERVVALDQRTGEVVWDVKVPPFDASHLVPEGVEPPGPMAYNFRWAPLAYDGKVVVTATRFEVNEVDSQLLADAVARGEDPGVAWINANLGRRAFVAALDADTGEEVWRWYTTKEGDWTGDFTPTAYDGTPLDRDLEAERALAERYGLGWAAGSASPWQIPTVDVERGLLFVTTGNPAPGYIDLMRPGDNLYSDGIAAISLDTGELVWFFQESPHGIYDMTTQNVLFDLEHEGRTVPALDLYDGGKVVWQVVTEQPMTGGTLVTAGGVVFAGEQNGRFNAYDAATGELLWSFQVGGPITAPPMTYEVEGRQYVAVASGAAATRTQRGGALLVAFALPLD